jgi:NADH-quinone oxidoreductase subunit F
MITDAPQIVTSRIGRDQSWTLDSYLATGGYQGLRRVVTMPPEDVHEQVNVANLLGRGGAGFEAGRKWGMLRKAEPVYLVINGDESEPATFKDHMLIEEDPHQVIEGALICAYATRCDQVFLFIRGEFGLGLERMTAAVNEAYRYGAAGADVFGTGWSIDLVVHPGAGAYICGEETALLESLEGKRGYPRIKPPFFPAAIGLYGAPTVVNNVETVSNLPWVALNGGDAFAALGTGRSKGTKIMALSGDVVRPGNYEVEFAKVTFRDLIYDDRLGGGMRDGNELKCIIPGGVSAPWFSPEQLDVELANEAIADAGSMAGSGAVTPMDHTRCMVRAAWRISRFFHRESCGQCTPCREGSGWVEKIMARIEAGAGRDSDLDLLMDVCDGIAPGVSWPPAQTTICVLGPSIPSSVAWGIRLFRDEFLAHVREGRCPFPPDRLARRAAGV